jgi:hypothetical protein
MILMAIHYRRQKLSYILLSSLDRNTDGARMVQMIYMKEMIFLEGHLKRVLYLVQLYGSSKVYQHCN